MEGDSAVLTKQLWNGIYSEVGLAYGLDPNIFLIESIEYLKMEKTLEGKNVLCLCEGEGRNALYLAELGCEVVAMDISDLALNNLNNEAEKRNLTHKITTIVSDLNYFDFLNNSPNKKGFDIIVSIFSLTYGKLRKKVRDQVSQSLKQNGCSYYIMTGR